MKTKRTSIFLCFLIIALLSCFFLVGCNKKDEEEPIDFTLSKVDGETDIALMIGEKFKEPGYKFVHDGEDMTSKVTSQKYKLENNVKTKTSSIDTSKSGRYEIVYLAGVNGKQKNLTRKIFVLAKDHAPIFAINTNAKYGTSVELKLNEKYQELGCTFVYGGKVLSKTASKEIQRYIEAKGTPFGKYVKVSKVDTSRDGYCEVLYTAQKGDFKKTIRRYIHIIGFLDFIY